MAKCRYKGCKFEAWDKDPDGLCIYHSHNQDKGNDFWDAFWDGQKTKRPINALDKFNSNGKEFYNFQGFVFPGLANFEAINFHLMANFSGAEFSEVADFLGAEFSGWADFSKATFSGKACFSRAKFSEETDFSKATFSGEANFSKATFSGEANFSGATVENADFSYADFKGQIFLQETIIKGNWTFRRADFLASAVFEKCKFENGQLIFDSVFMAEPEKINFSLLGENARRVAFVNILVNTLKKVGFVGMEFLDKGRIYTEDYLKKQEGYSENGRLNKAGLELSLAAYRGLRLNYEDSGLFSEARHFYIREMKLKEELATYRKPRIYRWFYRWISPQAWYRHISNCGENYWKALGWLGSLWLLFTLLHLSFGIEHEGRVIDYDLVWPPRFNFSWGDLGPTLFYSLKSLIPGFWMLGGKPATIPDLFATVLESVIGAIIITLFLLAVRRRFRR